MMTKAASSPLRALVLVWAILVATSLSSWQIGQGHVAAAHTGDVVVVLFIAIKIHLIGSYFMELKHAPRYLAAMFNAWIAAVCAMILIMI